jgi:hypothetical protein
MSVSKFNLDRKIAAANTKIAARTEVNMFCEIMEWSKKDVYFVGDDPHGVVSLGDYFLNMSDIHEVIANYEKHIERFGSNEELSKAIIRWYDWSIDYHNRHPVHGWEKVQQLNHSTGETSLNLPELDMDSKMVHKRFSKPVLIVDETDLQKPPYCSQMPASVAMYDYDREDWWLCELGVFYNDTFHVEITHWKYLDWPDDTHCPNLRSWLAGCPVDGLRDATPEWKEEQRKSQEAARQRVEECKQALEDTIKEEVKLNNF